MNADVLKFATLTLYENYYPDDMNNDAMNSAEVSFPNDYTFHMKVGRDLIEIVKISIEEVRYGVKLLDAALIPIQ